MPMDRSRSPDYQRKWYWYQDPRTGWWSWHYHSIDWTPSKPTTKPAASSTSTATPLGSAQTGSESGQPMMKGSKGKDAVVDMDVDG